MMEDYERETWLRVAEREMRRDGVLAADTKMALNMLGIDPDQYEEDHQ